MNKKLYFMILLTSLLVSCFHNQKRDDSIKIKLEDLFLKSIINEKTLIFRIDTITEFKWDKFLIIPPYTKLSTLSKKLHIDLSELKNTGIEYSDNKSILVFIKNNIILKYTEYPRNPGDFSTINSLELFVPDTAIFKLTKTDQKTIDKKDYYIIEKIY